VRWGKFFFWYKFYCIIYRMNLKSRQKSLHLNNYFVDWYIKILFSLFSFIKIFNDTYKYARLWWNDCSWIDEFFNKSKINESSLNDFIYINTFLTESILGSKAPMINPRLVSNISFKKIEWYGKSANRKYFCIPGRLWTTSRISMVIS